MIKHYLYVEYAMFFKEKYEAHAKFNTSITENIKDIIEILIKN